MSRSLDRTNSILKGFLKSVLESVLGASTFNTASRLPVLYQIMPELKRLLKHDVKLGLLFIDLVDFSSFAEQYGGKVADRVLRLIGQVLLAKNVALHRESSPLSTSSHFGSTELRPILPCTQGGDEFMLFYRDPPERSRLVSQLSDIGESLLDQIHTTLIKSHFQLPAKGRAKLGVHLGYAEVSRDENRSPEARIYEAVKEASLMAKSPLTPEDFLSREDILSIIEKGQLTQVYQPIVSLKDGSIFGFEALTRGPMGTRYAQPMSLFAHARTHNLLFRLEEVCRRMAVENAKPFLSGRRLFLNIDPAVVLDPDFKGGTTRVLLSQHGLNPQDVVLELTERSAIGDFDAFRKTLAHYRRQGYAIAIDDVGSGYSSLEAVLELRPSFIKIDRSLISGVHLSAAKRKIVTALGELASEIHCFSIAEGVEEEGELEFLVKAGIDFAQGYLLARPFYPPLAPKPELTSQIRSFACGFVSTEPRFPVADLVKPYTLLSPKTPVRDLAKAFSEDPTFRSVVIGKSNRRRDILGLVMRSDVMDKLASQYGYAVYAKKTVEQFLADERGHMSRLLSAPLSSPGSDASLTQSSSTFGLDPKGFFWAQGSSSVETLAQALASRTELELTKDILVFQGDTLMGLLEVRTIVEHLAKVQIQDALNANPLTGLPGNNVIEATIKRRFESKMPLSVIYIDLDNFKIFNDRYGFERGDQVILATSKIIKEAAGHGEDLVGHIGGDDFIVVSTPERAYGIAQNIISMFEQRIFSFYDEEERLQGYIVMKDREKVLRKHPIMTISVAIVPHSPDMRSHITFSEKAAELKRKLKEAHATSSTRQSSIEISSV